MKNKRKVYRLEVHTYAPELNELHFTDGTSERTPQCTTIDQALEYLNSQNS